MIKANAERMGSTPSATAEEMESFVRIHCVFLCLCDTLRLYRGTRAADKALSLSLSLSRARAGFTTTLPGFIDTSNEPSIYMDVGRKALRRTPPKAVCLVESDCWEQDEGVHAESSRAAAWRRRPPASPDDRSDCQLARSSEGTRRSRELAEHRLAQQRVAALPLALHLHACRHRPARPARASRLQDPAPRDWVAAHYLLGPTT